MTIYVTDANIFIDLIYAGLLDRMPLLGLRLTTTAFILDELDPAQQEDLQALVAQGSLTIDEVSTLEISQLIVPRGLSLPDRSVLRLALREDGILLSGDGLVRKTAGQLNLTVYGLLWVFDALVNAALISPSVAAEKLTFLVEEKGSRQPRSEYEQRLEMWEKMGQ